MMSDRITALIQATATRTPEETSALAGRLYLRSWPRGGDRIDPVAREWLRRWAPVRMNAGAAGCGCATGRCACGN